MQMWRMGVPVATPIMASDFFTAASALAARHDHKSDFERELRAFLGIPFVRCTNSGRAALFLVLRAMKRLSTRAEVVIPAYVCPSLGRAVVKAGLKPVLCDVEAGGSGLDIPYLDRVINRGTLAVVTAHLYGYPSDIAKTTEVAHSAGAMVIEDAAQAFGAKFQGCCVGTRADAGVFSFAMSKVLWTMGGGLIATSNPELFRGIEIELANSRPVPALRRALAVAKFGILAVLLRGHHLGPIAAIWDRLLRGKADCDDFVASAMPPASAAVARTLLRRLDEITRLRRQNASYFAAHLSQFDEIILPPSRPDSEPVFLRFPIVVKDLRVKKELLLDLRKRGINVSEMYGRESYDALQEFAKRDSRRPTTEFLAEHMLNLPTHPYMRERDLSETVAAFRSTLSHHGRGRLRIAAAV